MLVTVCRSHAVGTFVIVPVVVVMDIRSLDDTDMVVTQNYPFLDFANGYRNLAVDICVRAKFVKCGCRRAYCFPVV